MFGTYLKGFLRILDEQRIHEIPPKHLGAYSRIPRNQGELAQLARASALHAEGQRFESVILHEIMISHTSEREQRKINREMFEKPIRRLLNDRVLSSEGQGRIITVRFRIKQPRIRLIRIH